MGNVMDRAWKRILSGQLSAVSFQRSAFSGQLSAVSFQLSAIISQLWDLWDLQIPYVTNTKSSLYHLG
jgi:hypothetical protein